MQEGNKSEMTKKSLPNKDNKEDIHEVFQQMYGKKGGSAQQLIGDESNESTHHESKPSFCEGKSCVSDRPAYTPRTSHIANGSNKIVGLGYGANKVSQEMSNVPSVPPPNQQQNRLPLRQQRSLNAVGVKFGEKEESVRIEATRNKIGRFVKSNFAAVLVFLIYLVKMESVLSCLMTVGLTLYWYFYAIRLGIDPEWSGSGIDWVVLGFAVVTPITVSIGMAFRRRELALFHISRLRSFSFQFYLAHSIWDWDGGHGREKAQCMDTVNNDSNNCNMDWLQHTDQVLEHLIGIGDELSRFLTLPTSSRTYHRMLKSGRMEAAEIVELQYKLFDSLYTKRITKLTQLTELLKSKGLSATEGSRLRQYERYIGEAVEGLRMIKMYRTPQALRSFGRLFTLILPPLYAASFTQLAIDLQSLAMGILFAVITPLCLTALFESMTNLEDPFVGWTTLDGIDVAEELEVLHWHQLKSARLELYPNAEPFVLCTEDGAISGETCWQRREGDIFDLKMFEMNNSETANLGVSTRVSRYALDASSRKRSNEDSGIDGSGRVSHFAMDASGRSHRRNDSNCSFKQFRSTSNNNGY